MRQQIEKPYSQVAVWTGTTLGDTSIKQFEAWFKDNFDTRIKFLETIVTAPDLDSKGHPVEDTGGRHDIFFAVHEDDIGKFAPKRFQLTSPPRWVEDIYGNGGGKIYPEDVQNYKSWGDEE